MNITTNGTTITDSMLHTATFKKFAGEITDMMFGSKIYPQKFVNTKAASLYSGISQSTIHLMRDAQFKVVQRDHYPRTQLLTGIDIALDKENGWSAGLYNKLAKETAKELIELNECKKNTTQHNVVNIKSPYLQNVYVGNNTDMDKKNDTNNLNVAADNIKTIQNGDMITFDFNTEPKEKTTEPVKPIKPILKYKQSTKKNTSAPKVESTKRVEEIPYSLIELENKKLKTVITELKLALEKSQQALESASKILEYTNV